MRAMIKLLILVGLAVAIVLFFKDSQDVVMLITGDERRTIPLLTALLFLLLLFIIFYVLVRIITKMLAMPRSVSNWSDKRRENKDVALLENGLAELLEGSSSKAEKNLLSLLEHTHHFKRKIIASIAAARAAHQLTHFDKRDALLERARQLAQTNPSIEAAIATVQAELLLDQEGNATQALEHLTFASKIGKNHKQTHIQALKLQAYRQTGDTIKLLEIARQLVVKKVVSNAELKALVEHYGALYIGNASYEEATAFYHHLSREEKTYTSIASMMASRYEQLEEFKKAGDVLEIAIHSKVDKDLLAPYAKCPEELVNHRIQKAQAWLANDENNPDLLIALGQLCLIAKLWGQAERYLTKSLSIRDEAKVHALLGLLSDRQGRAQEAISHWRMASRVLASLSSQEGNRLAAADTSNDPAPPDVKNLDKPDDHFLTHRPETGVGEVTPKESS